MSLLDDIEDFYTSPLGVRTREALLATLKLERYTNHDGDTLIIGYGIPYIAPGNVRPFLCSLSSVGAYYWPHHDKNRAVHADSNYLPFPDQCFDRVIIIHGLEHAYHPDGLIREIWRILKGHGKALFIVPHRRSGWSRRERNPFAYGQPYSVLQLSSALKESKYTIETISFGLRLLPLSRFLPLNWIVGCEYWLHKLHLPFGGVLTMECRKRLYTPLRKKDNSALLKLRSWKLGSMSSS